MSLVLGAVRTEDDVVHRVRGTKTTEEWAPPVAWQIFTLCGREYKKAITAPTSANLQVTCVICLGRE